MPLWYICFFKQLHCSSHTLGCNREKNDCELESTLVDLGVGRRMGVGALICSMMNCRTARSNLPRGPAVKLTSLAGRRCPLRRAQTVALREECGHRLFVSMETNLGRTVCLEKGCERRTSPSNQLESSAETAWLGLG